MRLGDPVNNGIHEFINKQRLKYLQQKRDEMEGKREIDYRKSY